MSDRPLGDDPPLYFLGLWDVLAITEELATVALLSTRVADEKTLRARLEKLDDAVLPTVLQTARAVTVTSFELRGLLEEVPGGKAETAPSVESLERDSALLLAAAERLTLVPGRESHDPAVLAEARNYTQQALTFIAGVVALASSSKADLNTDLTAALLQMPVEQRRWMRGALDLVFWAAACLVFVLEQEPRLRAESAREPGDGSER